MLRLRDREHDNRAEYHEKERAKHIVIVAVIHEPIRVLHEGIRELDAKHVAQEYTESRSREKSRDAGDEREEIQRHPRNEAEFAWRRQTRLLREIVSVAENDLVRGEQEHENHRHERLPSIDDNRVLLRHQSEMPTSPQIRYEETQADHPRQDVAENRQHRASRRGDIERIAVWISLLIGMHFQETNISQQFRVLMYP